jgi:hypothetical protein
MTLSGLGLNESKFLARGKLPFALTFVSFLTGLCRHVLMAQAPLPSMDTVGKPLI